MAKTRHILFLITAIVACVGSANGGYYAQHSHTAQTTPNQSNESLNSNIGNVVSSGQNQQSDILTHHSSNENLNNEDSNISTRYELDQAVPQNINEEQYRSAINQLESEVHKPKHYYSNQEQALPNTIQSANIPSSVIQQTNPGSVNLLANQHNSVQSVNSNQIILQSESFRTTHLRSFYPPLYPNYANDGTIPQPTVSSLPLSITQSQVKGHEIQDHTHAQNEFPQINVETLPVQNNNLITHTLSAPSTFGIGQIPVTANVQNVLPQGHIGILPTQPANVQPLALSPLQPLVKENQVPVNYNVHNVLPYPNIGVISAQQNTAPPLPQSPSQVVVSEKHIPFNSGLHVLPQENVGTLAAQPNILPLPVSQHTLLNGNQIAIKSNVQNLPPLVNVPAEEQFALNGANGYSNIGIQNSQSLNVQPAPIAPRVTKDIYFHVAPSDFLDVPSPALPQKKTYKIIFIKLPSQERKNTALLQSLYSHYGVREDKTLIYVLVKKPEEQQVIIPQPKAPSQHEVIFVKYKNIKENSAVVGTNGGETNHDDILNESKHDVKLKPGLINGY